VLPSHIKSHLQRAHKIKQKQAEYIAERVGSCPGLIEYASEIQVPSQVVASISQSPVYVDGLLCQLDTARCCDWSVGSEGGHLSQTAQKEIQLHIDEACRRVHRITRREYDSPLVCALAVLGVKEEGWKGPEQYQRSLRQRGSW
jgi:hypothetical protein